MYWLPRESDTEKELKALDPTGSIAKNTIIVFPDAFPDENAPEKELTLTEEGPLLYE